MADLFKRFKRKNRTSDSDCEAKSPEGKRVCDEITTVKDDITDNDAITDNEREDDQILEALNMSENIGSKLQLILNKLEALEAKFETVVTTVNNLTVTVKDLEKTVNKVQGEVASIEGKTTKLRNEVDQMDKALSFLNTEVQELKCKQKAQEMKIKHLEDKIMYQKVYNRRENLRFLGIPESRDDEEDTKEMFYQFLEKELNIENARRIEFQRIHRIGKKSTSEVRPIIARFFTLSR